MINIGDYFEDFVAHKFGFFVSQQLVDLVVAREDSTEFIEISGDTNNRQILALLELNFLFIIGVSFVVLVAHVQI